MPAVAPCIYTIPGGYYVNWQLDGHVYRRAFTAGKYGKSLPKALAAAKAEVAFLNEHRSVIQEAMLYLTGQHGNPELATDADVTKVVREALRG